MEGFFGFLMQNERTRFEEDDEDGVHPRIRSKTAPYAQKAAELLQAAELQDQAGHRQGDLFDD